MATIHIHPALAADHKAAQALADQLGMNTRITGSQLHLVPANTPAVLPARIPSPSWQRLPRHVWPTGGDAA